MQKTVRVELGERSYDVSVGDALLAQLGETAAALPNVTGVAVVTDSNVSPLYGAAALESLTAAGLPATLLEFPAGEEHKTLATIGALFDALFAVQPAIDRNSLIVAMGGGVAGDISGFLAATALRGIRWLQCPTTLLADVDASVGGKTAVDHPAGKNLIGAFHQPSGVLIDVNSLKSLPARELRSGLAECVKHAVIADHDLLEFIEDNIQKINECDTETMAELVYRNVSIKARIVSSDERESGERALLNFGHTVGHAIEALAGYGTITHGEAVSLGMVAACRLAVQRGLIEQETEQRIADVLFRLGLPIRWDGLDTAAIWRIMLHDKKTRGGQVRMVLPVMLGQAAVFGDISPDAVQKAIEVLRK